MLRLSKPFVLLALVLVPLGCEGGAPWADEPPEAEPAEGPDLGPTAAYDRRLVFLGPGDALPTAGIFDFSTVSDSAGVRRGVRARVVDGSEWVRLLDAGWEMEPMRQPWRLVPHGPLRMTVTDAGDLAAIEVRDDMPVRVEPGTVIAEHAPDAGTQLVLRQGRLVLDDESLSGILLDAQLARAVPDTRPRQEAAAEPAATGPDTASADAVAAAAADTSFADTTGVVTPTARPGAEALLLDNSGYYLVLTGSASGTMAWIHSGGRDEILRGARLEAGAGTIEASGPVDTGEDAPPGVPAAWTLLTAAGDTIGQLTTEAADRSALSPAADASTLGYALVSGWVEERSVRREVFGLVRHVR